MGRTNHVDLSLDGKHTIVRSKDFAGRVQGVDHPGVGCRLQGSRDWRGGVEDDLVDHKLGYAGVDHPQAPLGGAVGGLCTPAWVMHSRSRRWLATRGRAL